jgi:hypothetical protein
MQIRTIELVIEDEAHANLVLAKCLDAIEDQDINGLVGLICRTDLPDVDS